MPALRRLDNKDRYCHDPPDKDDILDVIEAVHKDENTEQLFMEAFNACGPVMMMAIHVIAFNCLLHNPDAFAEESVKNAATDALQTNPTKQNVNQYLIDAILQKRRTVQRNTDNLWDRSLNTTGAESASRQTEHPRRHRIDTNDDQDNDTPGPSGSSGTPRRRPSPMPHFATASSPDIPSRRRAQQPVRRRPFTPPRESDEDEPTQLYPKPIPERRSRKPKRPSAADLPTSFAHEEEDEGPRRKNKRPLNGPATAKNRAAKVAETTSSDSEDHQKPTTKKATDIKKPPKGKHGKKPAAVLSSD